MNGVPRFQHGSLMRVKNKTTDDTWFFRYYEDVDGKRVYRKHRIGSVREFPHRRDAEKAVMSLRAKVNSEVRSPETVNELIEHYLKHELTTARKAYATVEAHTFYINRYVKPKWGSLKLTEVRTVAVEQWLESLSFAPGTRTKIRNVMSAIYSHGIRHEWITFNPISKVRTSAKRLREPDILSPEEFQALLAELEGRDRAIVLLAGSTGLRRSELFALKWADINFAALEVAVTKSCVRNHLGKVKTEASGRPVPLPESVRDALLEWRKESDYNSDDDFLFPSLRLNGEFPLSPDMVLKKAIRPAMLRAGIKGKTIGYHSFRHGLATNLRSLGVDIKVAQELLRHSNSRTTLEVYTRAVSAKKHEASSKVLEMLLPNTKGAENSQHLSAPLNTAVTVNRTVNQ
jgi:integrase